MNSTVTKICLVIAVALAVGFAIYFEKGSVTEVSKVVEAVKPTSQQRAPVHQVQTPETQRTEPGLKEHRLVWKQADGSFTTQPILNMDSEEISFAGGCQIAETIGGFGTLYHVRAKNHQGTWTRVESDNRRIELTALKVIPISPSFTGGTFKIRCPS